MLAGHGSTTQVMKGPDTINVVAMLGVRSSCTVMPGSRRPGCVAF